MAFNDVQSQNGLSFDGVDDYVGLNSTIYSDGVQNFTIECWIKTNSTTATGSNYHTILGRESGGGANFRNPSIYIKGGELHTDLSDQTSSVRYDVLTTNLDMTANVWYHIAFVKSGTTQYLYLNGKLVNTRNAPTGANISGNYNLCWNDNYFTGGMDEVRFWSTARTQAQINEYMTRNPKKNETGLVAYFKMDETSGTTISNYSTNNSSISGTIYGGATRISGLKTFFAPNSLDFDGINDYVYAPLTTSSTNSYSTEYWVKLKSGNKKQDILNIYDDLVSVPNAMISYVTSSNQLRWWMRSGGSTSEVVGPTLTLNRWYHIACVYSNGVANIYWEDELMNSGSATNSTMITHGLDGADHLTIGADAAPISGATPNSHSSIAIDEIRIWSTARTQSQVEQFRYQSIPNSTSGLISYYNFNFGSAASSNTDISQILDVTGANPAFLNNFTFSGSTSNLISQDTIVPVKYHWYGESNTVWSNTNNWSQYAAPVSGMDLEIDANTSNNPVLSSNLFCNYLSLPSGKTLTLNDKYLILKSGYTGTGSFVGSKLSQLHLKRLFSNTNLNLTQTSVGNTNALKVLSFQTNPYTLTASTSLEIIEKLEGITGTFNANGNVTFKSNSSKTANAIVSNNATVSGNVIVESFFPAKRAFRLISSPVNSSSSIYNNWQEGGSNSSGWGTHITGNGANGTDLTVSGNASLFTFNNSSATWNAITSTNNSSSNLIAAGTPYRILVRGDRTIDLTKNTSTASNTTLRTTGTLNTGNLTVNMSSGTVANADVLIGNPFQAPLNMASLLADNAVNSNFKNDIMYIWDPNINTRGAYVAVSLPSGANASNSAANKYLMPGQAAFLKTKNSGSASLVLSNSYIENTNRISTFREELNFSELKVQLFSIDSTDAYIVDGAMLHFSELYNSEFDENDASKAENLDENLSIIHASNRYSIVKRNYTLDSDTMQLNIVRYRGTKYQLLFKPVGMKNLKLYLWDKALDVKTSLSENENTSYNFEVGNATMNDENRFSLIVENDGSFSSLKTIQKDNIKIFPNPTNNGTVRIQGLDFKSSESIVLVDILGRKLPILTEIYQDSIVVNTGDLPNGLYFLNVNGEIHGLMISSSR
jgi:hypothetical protein